MVVGWRIRKRGVSIGCRIRNEATIPLVPPSPAFSATVDPLVPSLFIHLSSPPDSLSLVMTTAAPLFDPSEEYVQFTISKRTGGNSVYLCSTSVSWVPARLIDSSFTALLEVGKLSGKEKYWWVVPLWELLEKYEKECVTLSGRDLTKASGCTVKVVKQWFSCDEY